MLVSKIPFSRIETSKSSTIPELYVCGDPRGDRGPTQRAPGASVRRGLHDSTDDLRFMIAGSRTDVTTVHRPT